LASSNKFTSTAATLVEFLPALDAVEMLSEKYSTDEFGKQYNAVAGAMKTAFKELDVVPYEVKVGDIIDDARRIDVIESQYSTDYPKGSVIQVISQGMELKGNVVRPAKCVISLGVEQQMEPETPAEEVGHEGSDESDEGDVADISS
jgi:molecular chaperone GrpE (heat shock protein)